jgi:hypothetical protein
VAWIAGGLALLFLIAVIALFFIIRSARFHDYVLRTVQEKATAQLNTPVHLQNFALHLSSLSLDLYGLSVEGAGPGAHQPLLQADPREPGRKRYFRASSRVVCGGYRHRSSGGEADRQQERRKQSPYAAREQ